MTRDLITVHIRNNSGHHICTGRMTYLPRVGEEIQLWDNRDQKDLHFVVRRIVHDILWSGNAGSDTLDCPVLYVEQLDKP